MAAYDWYSWPDEAHHCNFSGTPTVPPVPSGITAVPTSPNSIQIKWAPSAGYTFVVSNGNTSSPGIGPGTDDYTWYVGPGTYMCFTVAAKNDGLQSPWSPYACATTPSMPWCPVTDATRPTCSGTIDTLPSPGDGAFQESCPSTSTTHCPAYDYRQAAPPTASDYLTYALGWAIASAMQDLALNNASKFLFHYLSNQGTNLLFDSTAAYRNGPGFAAAVDCTVKTWIHRVGNDANVFDSGYIGVLPSTWGSWDWRLAIGHGFYRVVGIRQPNGTWSVHLQLTSYYQFRSGENFPIPYTSYTIYGEPFRHLHKTGLAQNFKSIGNGTITFDSSGNPAS